MFCLGVLPFDTIGEEEDSDGDVSREGNVIEETEEEENDDDEDQEGEEDEVQEEMEKEHEHYGEHVQEEKANEEQNDTTIEDIENQIENTTSAEKNTKKTCNSNSYSVYQGIVREQNGTSFFEFFYRYTDNEQYFSIHIYVYVVFSQSKLVYDTVRASTFSKDFFI